MRLVCQLLVLLAIGIVSALLFVRGARAEGELIIGHSLDNFSNGEVMLLTFGLCLVVAAVIWLLYGIYRVLVMATEVEHSADYAAKNSLRGKIV